MKKDNRVKPDAEPSATAPVRVQRSVRRVKQCPIGTLVSYASVDGTCRQVENYRHAWLPDGTCGNCDMTREQAGYTPKWHELLARKKKASNAELSGGRRPDASPANSGTEGAPRRPLQ